MITDSIYWLALATLVLCSFLVPSKYRFQTVGAVSFVFLLVLLINTNHSLVPDGESALTDSTFILQRVWDIRVALYLFAFSALFYYAPQLIVRLGIEFKYVQISLILIVLSYLAYHKYIPVIFGYLAGLSVPAELLIPLGISYFTFKLIHYSIENGRGNFKPHTFSQFFTYIYLFPIYTAGPIERFDHFQNNWTSTQRKEDLIEGGTRIVYGLIKKFFVSAILLAPLLAGNDASSILSRIDSIEVYKVWGFLLVSYLLIYIDFSAYSDIAIGSSRMMGFKIMENFNWPIFATNISMLWKRWHMTLSGWCQSYVYMPTIGITRNPYLAVILTFLAVGLWHGGAYSWIAWGLYQGAGVLVYVIWSRFKMRRKIRIPANFLTNNIARIITNCWMAGSFAFTVTISHGDFRDVMSALRLLGRCFGI